MTSDLAQYTYGDLVAALRKDLLLDATTDILPGTILASLFDQNGKAAFLQLPTAQKLHLAFGSVSITFPGATTSSNAATVTHGLGATPSAVVLQNADPAGAAFLSTWVTATSSTTFTCKAFNTAFVAQGAGSFPFYWIAIG